MVEPSDTDIMLCPENVVDYIRHMQTFCGELEASYASAALQRDILMKQVRDIEKKRETMATHLQKMAQTVDDADRRAGAAERKLASLKARGDTHD